MTETKKDDWRAVLPEPYFGFAGTGCVGWNQGAFYSGPVNALRDTVERVKAFAEKHLAGTSEDHQVALRGALERLPFSFDRLAAHLNDSHPLALDSLAHIIYMLTNEIAILCTAAPGSDEAVEHALFLERQGRTQAANEARRADKVQSIIETHASELWRKRPSFKKNSYRTAAQIRQAVGEDLRKLDRIPPNWEPVGERCRDSAKLADQFIQDTDLDARDPKNLDAYLKWTANYETQHAKLVKKEMSRIAQRLRRFRVR